MASPPDPVSGLKFLTSDLFDIDYRFITISIDFDSLLFPANLSTYVIKINEFYFNVYCGRRKKF